MKLYRILLVLLLVAVVGCGAWYFYGVIKDSGQEADGTLVRKCEQFCREMNV